MSHILRLINFMPIFWIYRCQKISFKYNYLSTIFPDKNFRRLYNSVLYFLKRFYFLNYIHLPFMYYLHLLFILIHLLFILIHLLFILIHLRFILMHFLFIHVYLLIVIILTAFILLRAFLKTTKCEAK